MLARREHSAFEIRRKLKQKDLAEAEIEEAIERLQHEGLLSDERYAESYINMRRGKGYGPLRIALELRERGVAENDFGRFLYAGKMEWWSALQAAHDKKFGSAECADYQEKAKRIRFLQYRGFALDKIHELLSD